MKNRKNHSFSTKRFRWGLCGVVCTLLLTACEDLLVEKPKSIVVETFFNTAGEVESATNAIYAPLRANRFTEYEATLEAMAEYAYGRGRWAPLHEFQGFNDVNINRVATFWDAFYLSIRNANLVIQNAPNGTAISQADITRFVGEAKFLRAFNYFQLVRNWGGVPLRTEQNMTIGDLPKSSPEAVYNLILADLTEAETSLPDNPTHVGRPTRWAAKTLLADVYLQLGEHALARDKADEVMKSNKFSLVPVTSRQDFQLRVFGPELLTTPEEIFYLKYARQVGQGNYMLWITNHPSTNLFNFGGAYAIHSDATNPFYQNWDNADLRKALWDRVNIGLGATSLVSAKFIDQNAIAQNGAGNDDPVYGYSDVLLMYAEAAARAAGAPTPEALEALNKVHRRAYGQAPNTPSSVDYVLADYTATTFLELVSRERAYEFQLGGKRWLELKRTGRANEVIRATKGITIAEKHYLWPLPLSELNFNKALTAADQNPGY